MILSISLLSWKTWAVPFIGAFIGWITNWLAIKMLFKVFIVVVEITPFTVDTRELDASAV